jgi:hypothetical protein
MRSRPKRVPTPNRLLLCVLINQFATPGLGSLLARRRVSGAGQLLLALAGFGLIVVWMFQCFYSLTIQELNQTAAPAPPDWMWNWGWILFGASWVWALLTSIGLLLQVRRLKRAESGPAPPRLPDPPAAPGAPP